MSDDPLAFLRDARLGFCLTCLMTAFPGRAVRQRLATAIQAGEPLVSERGRCATCGQPATVTSYRRAPAAGPRGGRV
jgi:hypothetical protein